MNEYNFECAILSNDIPKVKEMVSQYETIREKYDYDLILYAAEGKLEVLKNLVEKGTDISRDKGFALKLAVKNEHDLVVKYLIEKCENIYQEDALTKFVVRGDLENGKVLGRRSRCRYTCKRR